MKHPYTILVKNCKPYSHEWFHEQRHKQQEEKHGLLSVLAKIQFPLILLTGLTISLNPLLFAIGGVCWMALTGYITGLELDAEIYAWERRKQWK